MARSGPCQEVLPLPCSSGASRQPGSMPVMSGRRWAMPFPLLLVLAAAGWITAFGLFLLALRADLLRRL